jgi:hypothetical protein
MWSAGRTSLTVPIVIVSQVTGMDFGVPRFDCRVRKPPSAGSTQQYGQRN